VLEAVRADLDSGHMGICDAPVAIELAEGLPHRMKDHFHRASCEAVQRIGWRLRALLMVLEHLVNECDEVASHQAITLGCRFILNVVPQAIQKITAA